MIFPQCPNGKSPSFYGYCMIFLYHVVKEGTTSNFTPALLLEFGTLARMYVTTNDVTNWFKVT